MSDQTGWSAPDRPTPAAPAPGLPRVTLPAGPRPPGSPPYAPPPRITLPPGLRPPSVPGPPPPVRAAPSGLFPSGPPRPTYREANPVRLGQVSLGALAGALWMTLFGLMATNARGYAWWSISAGLLAWLTALALGRYGLRGIAVGVSITVGAGLAIVGVVVMQRWIGGHWLLW